MPDVIVVIMIDNFVLCH